MRKDKIEFEYIGNSGGTPFYFDFDSERLYETHGGAMLHHNHETRYEEIRHARRIIEADANFAAENFETRQNRLERIIMAEFKND